MTTAELAPPTETGVHVWPFDLDDAALDCDGVLAPDESARRDRFKFERGARHYARGRATVRRILARYLGVDPATITFAYNDQGRPELVGDAPVRFNLAHSGEHALLVIGGAPQLGCDLEVVRPGFATDGIAERFFAPAEVDALRARPPAEQEAAFFRCWTRKESFIKALGGGLSIPLDSFTVVFATAAEPPAVTWIRDDPAGPAQWQLRDLSAYTPGCVSALAVRSAALEVPVLFDLHG